MNVFAWAKERWADPLSGTEVVRLSPDLSLHFRNPYFRSTMFTRDGAYMALLGEDPDDDGRHSAWVIDLGSGAAEQVHEFTSPPGMSRLAFSPQSHLLHLTDQRDGRAEITQIDVDSGSRRTIRPSIDLPSIGMAECTADDGAIFATMSFPDMPEDTPATEQVARRGVHPGRNLLYRIDLNSGETTVVFETEEFWLEHANPNPADPDLFMCCQEGFNWTERYPMPANYQRQRILDLSGGEWLNLRGSMQSRGTHEHWSANGRRVYSHGDAHGLHAIYIIDLDTESSRRYLCPPAVGMSIHAAPAPDESFVIGDGFNFCQADRAAVVGAGTPGDGDNPWSWDGIWNESPGETIWHFELPKESVWTEDRDFASAVEAREAVVASPERTVRTRPLCRFRSLAKMTRTPMRLESNAHVTRDNGWGVFQSAGEHGRLEVWAARVELPDDK